MPNGKPLELIVETAGESSEEADVLELIRADFQQIGIKVFTRPSQRDVFRDRIFSGQTTMSVWQGLENGLPTADMRPWEVAPTSQQQLQWPQWGQFVETKGEAGIAPTCRKPRNCWRSSAPGGRAPRRGGARDDLARDAGDLYRPGLHDRHHRRRAAAGRGQQPSAQRTGGRASTTGIPARISASTSRIRSGYPRPAELILGSGGRGSKARC